MFIHTMRGSLYAADRSPDRVYRKLVAISLHLRANLAVELDGRAMILNKQGVVAMHERPLPHPNLLGIHLSLLSLESYPGGTEAVVSEYQSRSEARRTIRESTFEKSRKA
jgi:hypothetical protein